MRRSTSLAFLILLAGLARDARAQAPVAAPDTTVAQNVVPRLTNFAALATILNLARGAVRLVAVVSPSAPGAEAGMDAVASMLRDIPSKRLRAFVIISQTDSTDTRGRALNLAARHIDRRIVYLWDPDATTAAAMAASDGLAGMPARDVLLLYDTAATFTTTVPAPVAWVPMDDSAGPVASAALRGTADELVRAVERKAATAGGGE